MILVFILKIIQIYSSKFCPYAKKTSKISLIFCLRKERKNKMKRFILASVVVALVMGAPVQVVHAPDRPAIAQTGSSMPVVQNKD